MKRLIIAAGLLFGVALAQTVTAQVAIVNIGSQPVWGPVGYDYVDYYYLPDIDMYYHVPTQQYVYLVNRRWVIARVLPPHLRGYDFYRGYKVVINEPRPYLYHDRYREYYGHYRGRMGQAIIRDSRDSRYFVNPGHPAYNRPNYANRNQNYYRDQYDHRYERYESNNRRRNDRNNQRDDRYNDYRTENNNRFRNDNDNRHRNNNDTRFRDNNESRFRYNQTDREQFNARSNRGRD
ncbi:MAG: hypothetical protein ACO1OF_15940 [Adhaeribacter sp.]